jgi:hypothetical protein
VVVPQEDAFAATVAPVVAFRSFHATVPSVEEQVENASRTFPADGVEKRYTSSDTAVSTLPAPALGTHGANLDLVIVAAEPAEQRAHVVHAAVVDHAPRVEQIVQQRASALQVPVARPC